MSETKDKGRRLVIRVGRQSMAFSTITEGSDVAYESYPFKAGISVAANMREAIRTADILRGDYSSVLVMVDTEVMVVPAEEYSEQHAGLMYRHAFTGHEQHSLLSAVMPDLHAVVLFAVERDLQTVLADHWQRVRYVPSMMPVWHHLHQRSYTGPRAKLYVYFHDRQMDVFAFAKNRFRFCNAFDAVQADDALYYLLSVWKQLGMEADRDELYLVGELPGDTDFRAKAEEFIKRVYMISPVGEFNRAAPTRVSGMPYDVVTLYVKGL